MQAEDIKPLINNAPFTVTPAGPTIGAEISGINLAEPLGQAAFDALYATLMEYKVIYFHNQKMTADQQVAFGKRFGELEVHPFRPDLPNIPEMIVLDNHKDNPVLSTDIWHADTTFREEPTRFSILRCMIKPEFGGDTLWADMVSAYECLSTPVKEMITGLEALHDFKNFSLLYADDEEGQQKLLKMRKLYPRPTHPVVRTHPDTRERVLYVNPQFTIRMLGMSVKESDAILNLLYEQSKTPEYQFRLHWEPDTLCMWDNAGVQHYASNDYWPHRRRMERVAVIGEKPYFDPDAKPASDPKSVTRAHAYEGLH
ncbi:MAG: TauD/TfdA dioxygenase family protein [Pseudomonadales bacterium]|jgi:taurine dioxygenase